MIDQNGYRSNVGIVLANPAGQVLWARRVGGGMRGNFLKAVLTRVKRPSKRCSANFTKKSA